MVNTQLKILRVFGPTGAEVSSVLRGIRDDGCPGLRLLERDGEFAICVQVSAPNRAMAVGIDPSAEGFWTAPHTAP